MNDIITLNLGFSNAVLIKNGRGAILVDTGINVSPEKYRKIFNDMSFDPRKIKLIIITHGHADHFAQAGELREMTGAPILCHKKAVHALETVGNSPIVPRNELGKHVLKLLKNHLPQACRPIHPNISIDSTSFDLHCYGVEGRIIHTPGHTDCSISVILNSSEAIVGDMLVPSPITGEVCVAYLATDEKSLFNSLHTVLGLAHTFYGGHGGPFTKQEVLIQMNSVCSRCC